MIESQASCGSCPLLSMVTLMTREIKRIYIYIIIYTCLNNRTPIYNIIHHKAANKSKNIQQ